ncbi:MAG: carbohydrate kinase, partial [Muribaculaceae bacterium]|nr:carbohydrate kinase [Muribaculaceae bacterium]
MYLLGYDIGTSSVKASLVDVATGRAVASDFYPKQEAPIKALHQGWAEQNPDSWWNYLKEATAAVIRKAGIKPEDIAAIGFSYQMHGLVCIDENRRPLRDAIIWCDSRAVPYGRKAFEELGADKCLGHLLNSPGNFTAAKLAWVKENEPELFERIYKIMLPADYISMRMTGEIVTNPEGLSEMMLWDFKNDAPAAFLMEYFGFPADILPELRTTFCEQGRLTPEAAADLGLVAGIPVTYRAGDQPNNALSLNVFEPGEIASTAGTSGVVYGVNGNVNYDPLSRVNNFAHVNHTADAPRIGVLTCINGTGILNSWVKRNIAPAGISYDDMNALAAEIPAGSEGVSVLPFGNGAERLLENREAGCSIHGINFNVHDRRHIIRAAQEGIVFAFMYGIEIMQQLGLKVDRIHAG